ncbi:hypothetical protein [Geoalkalibacter sp.]|nr:hypothetical protein [Geoalkalibacter sp.]
MIWNLLIAALILAWTLVFLTAFCPLRAARRRQEAELLSAPDENGEY